MPDGGANWILSLTAADKTAQAFRSVDQKMMALDASSKATSSMMSAGFAGVTRLLGPLAAAFTAAALAQKVWNAGMRAGDLGEQAEQVGLTTDQLQAYQLVAAQSGVSVEQLDGMMMKLTRSMGTANDGSDEMIAKFEKLGVKLRDSNGQLRKTADVMPELARGLLSVASATERDALMQEFLGRAGTRGVTMLDALAQGNDKLVESAKRQNAVIGPETIAAWDALGDQLKVASQRTDTLIASLGAPIADGGLKLINGHLNNMVFLLGAAQKGWDWMAKGGQGVFSTSSEDLIKRDETLKAMLDNIKDSTDALDVAKSVGMRKERQEIGDTLASRVKVFTMPPITVAASRGDHNPPGNKTKAAGDKDATAALREMQQAMDELVRTSQAGFDAATAVMIKYGDGTQFAAQEMAKLDESSAFITDPAIMLAAQKAITDQADAMGRAYRGATGGLDGFMAGIEQGFVEMDKMNSAFMVGQQMSQMLANSFVEMAQTGELNFQKLLGSFANMVQQMLIQAAMASALKGLFGALGGGGAGGTGAGLLDGLFGLIMGNPFGGLAAGGPIGRGDTHLVGENGPELFTPGASGRIWPTGTGPAGGGTTVIVQQTVHVGEFVTTSQYTAGLQRVERSAKQGAMAALVDRRRRGGLKDVF